MSPTVAELVVGLIFAGLVFMLAARLIPIIVRQLAEYLNRSVDDYEHTERNHDPYER